MRLPSFEADAEADNLLVGTDSEPVILAACGRFGVQLCAVVTQRRARGSAVWAEGPHIESTRTMGARQAADASMVRTSCDRKV